MHFMHACTSQCCCQASSLITHLEVMSAFAAGNDLEESGWKMVSGDVFRPPKNAIHLCVQIGSGVQIITSAFATLFFAALGECPFSNAASHQCSVLVASLSCYHLYFISSVLSLQTLACLHSLPVIKSEYGLICTAVVPYQAGTNISAVCRVPITCFTRGPIDSLAGYVPAAGCGCWLCLSLVMGHHPPQL